jgi:hypothetical protein
LRKTLESIWRFNHDENLLHRDSVERTYVLNDEQALVVCNYGNLPRPRIPFPYSTEAWTGQEYLAATLFLLYGMPREGVESYAAVRRRYDGERRNPFNEPECGHHYARAMSSWSGFAVMAGLRYDGPTQHLRFDRRAGATAFRSFWATGTGWGRYQLELAQGRTRLVVETSEGRLPIGAITIEAPGATASVRSGGRTIAAETEALGARRRVALKESLTLTPGQRLEIAI